MVKVITIRTSGDITTAIQTLDRIKRRTPELTREGMRRWGTTLARDMKYSAHQAGINNFTGTLQGTGIRWDQGQRSDTGSLFVRLYGVYLDSMGAHWVGINRRRTRLLAWAQQARGNTLRSKANAVSKGTLPSFSIYVRPHPFIRQGYRKARPKLRPILKSMVIRGVHQ